MFGFGFLFFFANLGWNIINSTDRIMIKFYLPSEELAFYAIAALVVTTLTIISSTAAMALIPSLSAARSSGNTVLFKKQIHNTSRLGLMILIPMATILFTLAGDIFEIVLPEYSASASVLRILVLIGFVDITCRIAWASLVAYGSGGKAATAYILAASLNIALNLYLIPRYGIEGAAVATILSFLLLAFVLQIMMSIVADVRIGIACLIHPLLLALVFPLLGWLFPYSGNYARVICVLIPGSAAYIILASISGLIRGEDLEKSRIAIGKHEGSAFSSIIIGMISVLERFRAKR